MRAFLNRSFAGLFRVALLALFATLLQTGTATSKDMAALLNAPVWYIQYEASFKGSSSGSNTSIWGPATYTSSLERFFSAALKLETRMPGPNQLMDSSTDGTASGAAATTADQMQQMQEMLARMDNTAHWINMPVGQEYNSIEEMKAIGQAHTDASLGTAKMEYSMVVNRVNQVNEVNQRFNETIRITRSGSGKALPGESGPGSIMFQVDAASKQYSLLLPASFNDNGATLKMETIDVTEVEGESPVEKRTSEESGLSSFPEDFTVDDPAQIRAGMVLIHGDLDPSVETISGEFSVKARYSDDIGPAEGTLVLRYTLSTTAPAKPLTSGK